MLGKILLNIFFIILITIIQIGFIGSLPHYLNEINIVIISLIFILETKNFISALSWGIGFGFILDVFSFQFFGINIVSIFLSIAMAHYLHLNFFTDKSIYAYSALIFFTCFSYEVLINIFYYFEIFFKKQDYGIIWTNGLFLEKIAGFLVNIILTVVFFYFFNYLSNRLKPVFLFK